jgi:hypothetical protein
MGRISNLIDNIKLWFATREQRAQEKELREIEKAKEEILFLRTQKEGLEIINHRNKLREDIKRLKSKPDRFSISKFDSKISSNYNNLEDNVGKKNLPKIL